MKKHCCTKEPLLKIKKEIIKYINSYENKKTKSIGDEEIINIKIVYHICYLDSNENIERDIINATRILNEDFNKKSSNFDNGREIYNVKNSNITLLKYRPYKSYKKPKKYIRITRNILRNRRRYIREIRRNRNRRRYNRRARIYNRRSRRYNRRARRYNSRIRKINRIRQKIIDNYNNLKKISDIYNDYISRSDTCNINFIYDKKIINPINNIETYDLSVIDEILKINHSPIQSGDEYKLNIWIVNFDHNLLGYAQFPWDLNIYPKTDGVVIDMNTFKQDVLYSNYNLGKTLSHEVGHWFGLYHVFQESFTEQVGGVDTNNDGVLSIGEITGDLVQDTPPQNEPTYGNPYTNKEWPTSVINGITYYNMFMNLMDYSYDINLFMLTKEQCYKVRLFINTYRYNFHYVN